MTIDQGLAEKLAGVVVDALDRYVAKRIDRELAGHLQAYHDDSMPGGPAALEVVHDRTVLLRALTEALKTV